MSVSHHKPKLEDRDRVPTRIDFVCDFCGHTIATVNRTGQNPNMRCTMTCPKCDGQADRVTCVDATLAPTHEWFCEVKREVGRMGIRKIEVLA